MRIIGYVLSFVGVASALAGVLFGHASWVGLNGHSVPTWKLLEFVAGALLVLGLMILFFGGK